MIDVSVILVAAQDDPASLNMKKALQEFSEWEKCATFDDHPVLQNTHQQKLLLLTIQGEKIFREHLDTEIQKTLECTVDQLVFLSRHTSKTGKPTLTVHPIGNYRAADFGGKPHTLVPSSPRLMTRILRQLYAYQKKTQLSFEVCYEVTHHGPYVQVPTFFIEVGSTAQQWHQYPPAQLIARSLLDIMITQPYEHQQPTDSSVLIGIGGGHYAPRFTDVILEKNAAFGHMIPLYQIQEGEIQKNMIDQALENTSNVQGMYLHKKTLKKSQITAIKNLYQDSPTPVISSKQLPLL